MSREKEGRQREAREIEGARERESERARERESESNYNEKVGILGR